MSSKLYCSNTKQKVRHTLNSPDANLLIFGQCRIHDGLLMIASRSLCEHSERLLLAESSHSFQRNIYTMNGVFPSSLSFDGLGGDSVQK